MSDLIECLLHIEKHPGMYFGSRDRARSIHILEAFIIGFQCAKCPPTDSNDLAFFREWVGGYYDVRVDGQNGFLLILEHVNGDERMAFDEFFRLLPEYLRERKELGVAGIMARFDGIQEKRWAEFRRSLRKQ